jgi:hypothetical protein
MPPMVKENDLDRMVSVIGHLFVTTHKKREIVHDNEKKSDMMHYISHTK